MKGTGELILYLDYDGVLHHENCLWHPKIGAYLSAPDGYVLFQHAELLEQLLAPHPQVQIVLSTALLKHLATSDKDKNEHVRNAEGDAVPEMDYPHESGLSFDDFLRLERADAYMRQQCEELEITRVKVQLAEAVVTLKEKEARRLERWKTILAVSAGVAGVVGFLIAMAAVFLAR